MSDCCTVAPAEKEKDLHAFAGKRLRARAGSLSSPESFDVAPMTPPQPPKKAKDDASSRAPEKLMRLSSFVFNPLTAMSDEAQNEEVCKALAHVDREPYEEHYWPAVHVVKLKNNMAQTLHLCKIEGCAARVDKRGEICQRCLTDPAFKEFGLTNDGAGLDARIEARV